MTGAVLFARTFANLLTVDAGFREDNILIASLDLSQLRIPVAGRLAVKKEIVDRLHDVPGVEADRRLALFR